MVANNFTTRVVVVVMVIVLNKRFPTELFRSSADSLIHSLAIHCLSQLRAVEGRTINDTSKPTDFQPGAAHHKLKGDDNRLAVVSVLW